MAGGRKFGIEEGKSVHTNIMLENAFLQKNILLYDF